MKELLEYLAGQVLKFEMEGIKTNLEKEVNEVLEKFSKKVEEEREKTTKKLAYTGSILTGAFFVALGIGFVIDTVTNIKGLGFIIVGVASLIAAQLIK